jgi:hypothetical protein
MATLGLGVGLLPAFTFDVRGPGLPEASTMRALGDWSTLLVDMGQWSIMMLTSTDTMASDAGIASILLSFDQHCWWRRAVGTLLGRVSFGLSPGNRRVE